jgi:tRNA nucleotidyltransferase (CCA-adding enzyme)
MKNYFKVLKYIKDKGFKCWLIGSAVREIIMRRVPVAFSIVTDAPSYEALIEVFGGEIIRTRTYPFVQAEICGETAQMSVLKNRTIRDELAARDFSINAIAIRWDGFIEDPFNGQHDIRNRLVRLTSDNVELLNNNPLRVLRLMRFAVYLDMNIYWKSEMDARIFIETHKDEIINSVSLRWGREIFIGMREKPYDMLRLMDYYGLVSLLIPKLEFLKEIRIVDGGTLFSHTLETLREMQNYFQKRKPTIKDLIITLAGHFHHIGSTYGSPVGIEVSSKIAREYLKMWGATDSVIDRVLIVMREYRMFYSERSEYELCRFAIDNGFDTIKAMSDFCLCNIRASLGDDAAKSNEIIVQNDRKLHEVLRRFEEMWYKMEKPNSRYITGEEIAKRLNLSPSIIIKNILRQHDELVGVGEITSRRDAVIWLENFDVSVYA